MSQRTTISKESLFYKALAATTALSIVVGLLSSCTPAPKPSVPAPPGVVTGETNLSIISSAELAALLDPKKSTEAAAIRQKIQLEPAEIALTQKCLENVNPCLAYENDVQEMGDVLGKLGSQNLALLEVLFPSEFKEGTAVAGGDLFTPAFILDAGSKGNWDKMVSAYGQSKEGLLLSASYFMLEEKLLGMYLPYNSAIQENLKQSQVNAARAAHILTSAYLVLSAKDVKTAADTIKTARGKIVAPAEIEAKIQNGTALTPKETQAYEAHLNAVKAFYNRKDIVTANTAVQNYQMAQNIRVKTTRILQKNKDTRDEVMVNIPQEYFNAVSDLLAKSATRSELQKNITSVRGPMIGWLTTQGFVEADATAFFDKQMTNLNKEMNDAGAARTARAVLQFVFAPIYRMHLARQFGMAPETADAQAQALMAGFLDKVEALEIQAGYLNENEPSQVVFPKVLATQTYKYFFDPEKGDKKPAAVQIAFQDEAEASFDTGPLPLNLRKINWEFGGLKVLKVRQGGEYFVAAILTTTGQDRPGFALIPIGDKRIKLPGGKEALAADEALSRLGVQGGMLIEVKSPARQLFSLDGKLDFSNSPIEGEVQFRRKGLSVNGLPLETAVSEMMGQLQNSDDMLFNLSGLPQEMNVGEKFWYQHVFFRKDTPALIVDEKQQVIEVTTQDGSGVETPVVFERGALIPIRLDLGGNLVDFVNNAYNPLNSSLTIAKIKGKEYLKLQKIEDGMWLAVEFPAKDALVIGERFSSEMLSNEMMGLSRFLLFAQFFPLGTEGGIGMIPIRGGKWGYLLTPKLPPLVGTAPMKIPEQMFTSFERNFIGAGGARPAISQIVHEVQLYNSAKMAAGGGVVNVPKLTVGGALEKLMPIEEQALFINQVGYVAALKFLGFLPDAGTLGSTAWFSNAEAVKYIMEQTPSAQIVPEYVE